MRSRFTPELIREYTEKGYWGRQTVAERFDQTVEAHPDKLAIIDSQGRTTFRELALMANRLALGLAEAGVRPGERVAAQLPNRAEALAVVLALARIGAPIAPAVHYYRAAEMEHIVKHSEAAAAIIPGRFDGHDYVKMMESIRPRLPLLRHVFVMYGESPAGTISLAEILQSRLEDRYPPDHLAPFRPDANDVMVLNYSSGSEAAPKAPMMTHNILLLGSWRTQNLGMTQNDVALAIAPLYHGFGLVLAGLAACVCHGATLVLMDRFIPEDALALVQQEGANLVFAVPPQIVSLLAADLSRYDLSSLRALVTAGAAVAPEVIRQVKERMGCTYINMWGSTEGGSLMCRLDDPPKIIATTVGRPAHPSIEFRVMAEDGVTEAPRGEIGEIGIRGPTVFAGYFQDPERTAAAFNPEGFFLTGDLGYVGEDGNMRLVGRKKEMINRGGEQISPREIEELLLGHPGIAEVAMVAMPDPRLGERACAYVVPRNGAQISLSDLVSFLRARGLATFKLPERLEVVPSLPMTPSGKVRKNLLREDVARKLQQGT